MGAYINLPNQIKESFLKLEGEYIGMTPPDNYKREHEGETQFAVCLIDNGPFFAAGITYSQDELKAFNKEDDPRPKRWYWVSKEDLFSVSDLKNYLN